MSIPMYIQKVQDLEFLLFPCNRKTSFPLHVQLTHENWREVECCHILSFEFQNQNKCGLTIVTCAIINRHYMYVPVEQWVVTLETTKWLIPHNHHRFRQAYLGTGIFSLCDLQFFQHNIMTVSQLSEWNS